MSQALSTAARWTILFSAWVLIGCSDDAGGNRCGDGICEFPEETVQSCPADCSATCGNGVYEPAGGEECDGDDFGTQSCKEIMRLSGGDRDIALAFAHGYMLGKKGTTRYNVDALAKITDQFIDYCLDHPAENALQSFEKFAR